MLARRGVAPQLLLVGDGPEREQPGGARAERAASPRGSTFTGAVAHDEVPAYLAAADVGAATYHPETGRYFSPLKLFEYQAAGLPVVAAEVGEIPHCVRPGETGLLYPPGDVERSRPRWQRSSRTRARAPRSGATAAGTCCATTPGRGTPRAVVALAERRDGRQSRRRRP